MTALSWLSHFLLVADAHSASSMHFGADTVTELLDVANQWSTIAAERVDELTTPQLLKLAGLIGALIALLPHVQALRTVRTFMVSCTVPMNLTGKRLKTREPYEGPIRSILFVFALFLFYQIFSQFSGLAVSATAETLMLDLFFQLSLFIWLLWQMRKLEHVAREQFADDGEKTKRILSEIDGALCSTGIRLNSVFWTAALMPLLALLPKAIEATGETTLLGAFTALTANLAAISR